MQFNKLLNNLYNNISKKKNIPLITSIIIIIILIIGLSVGFVVNDINLISDLCTNKLIIKENLEKQTFNMNADVYYFWRLYNKSNECRLLKEKIPCSPYYDCANTNTKKYIECVEEKNSLCNQRENISKNYSYCIMDFLYNKCSKN